MCDYSLASYKSRPAVKDEKLTTRRFLSCTTGLVSASEPDVAVCILPGSCLVFDAPAQARASYGVTAWFKQIDTHMPMRHHDAIEFDTGDVVLLNDLTAGQTVTVAYVPGKPQTPEEAQEQERLAVVA